MYIVQVSVEVKSDRVQDFIDATLLNARESVKETGISKFDVLQDRENPHRFLLNEVYRTSEDPARHKQTPHYQQWKDVVAEMMAAPRTKKIYENVYPIDEGWG